MIIDKSYFLNKFAEKNNDSGQEFNAKIFRPQWINKILILSKRTQ